MRDSNRFLRPEVIQRISRLDLRARAIVEGFLTGVHRSPFFGQSIEFRQHREYAVGDDLRHVDWKVWARQDRMYVKQFEEDTNLRLFMLVDGSRSMQYGRGPLNKLNYAATLATCLAYLVLRQQDAVACVVFDQQLRSQTPCRSGRSHLQTIIQSLQQTEPLEKTDFFPILKRAAEKLTLRGMVAVITDGFAPREGLFKGLAMLRQRGHDVLLFHLLDDDEVHFEFSGPIRFDDLESTEFLACNPRALRSAYLAALDEFQTEIRKGCAKLAIDYAFLQTSQPLDAALSAFLARRQLRRGEQR